MHTILRQSTAAQSVAIGPFIDDTDFKSVETGLTIANTDIKLVANGGAAANKNSGGATHRANGIYGITLDATDTAAVGELQLSVVVAGALPVFHTFTVVEPAVYDRDYADAAVGYVATQVVGSVTALADGSVTAATLAADAVAEIQSGLATAAALATVDDFIDTEVAAIKAKTDLIPADPATETTLATLATAAALATVDDFLDTEVAAIKAKTDLIPADPATETTLATLATQASVNTIDDFLDTEIAAIKAKTDNLPASPAATGDIPSANAVADALLDRTDAVESSLTVRQALRLIAAASAGKLSGAGTTTITIRNIGDSADRITATVDADGNRSAVTVNA